MSAKSPSQSEAFGDTTWVFLQNLAPLPQQTVLIVAQNTAVRERLVALTQSAGFEVATAAGGDEALGFLRREYCPVVISEWALPELDGVQLCKAIRADSHPGYVYLLLIADGIEPKTIVGALEAGVDDYLSARITETELIARIRTARRVVALEQSLRGIMEEKRKLATTDPLTGINNRRYFYKHLDRELKRVQRYGGPLSLLALNLDYLASINERFGTKAADEIVIEFSRRIALGLTREIDWCARISPEEFVVVLPQTDSEGASAVAEKLRHMTAHVSMLTAAGPLGVTVSVGATTLHPAPGEATPSVDALLKIAERNLAASKQAGRNRITADPPQSA